MFATRALTLTGTIALVSMAARSTALAGPPEPSGTTAPIVAPSNASPNLPLTIPSSGFTKPGAASGPATVNQIDLPPNRQHVMARARLVPNASTTPSPRERAMLAAKGLTESSLGARETLANALGTFDPRAENRPAPDVRIQTFPFQRVQRTSAAIAASSAIFNATVSRPSVVGSYGTSYGAASATQPQSLGTNQTPPPQIANVAVDGSYQNKSIATNQMLTIDGSHFGSTAVVKLRFATCGEITLVSAPQGDDRVVASVPFLPVNLMKAPAQLVVSTPAGESNAYPLTYLADLDLVVATVATHPWPDKDNGNTHVYLGAGGLPLVEGSSMSTSSGDARYSGHSGWMGGRGGAGVDTYFSNVVMLNDWHVVDNAFTYLYCSTSTNSKDLTGCDAQFFASPVANSTGLFRYGATGSLVAGSTAATLVPANGGSTNPTTAVTWSYDADHLNYYSVTWAFLGPHGKRAMSIYPAPLNLGGPIRCEQ